MLHRIIHFSLHNLSSSRLQEVENKGKFQTDSSKRSCSRLWEVVAYKMFKTWRFDWETFGMFENWSLTRCGHNWRLGCICNRKQYDVCGKRWIHECKVLLSDNFTLTNRLICFKSSNHDKISFFNVRGLKHAHIDIFDILVLFLTSFELQPVIFWNVGQVMAYM